MRNNSRSPRNRSQCCLALAGTLLISLAPVPALAQTVEPDTAHDALEWLAARHFGGPGDATIDYLGQLIADLIDAASSGAAPRDRAETLGRTGATSIGVDYQALRFRRFDGLDLDAGEISSFRGGLARVPITYVTTATVSADVTTVSAAVAVSPRVDVAVSAPLVRLRISGELQAIEDKGTPFEEPAAPPVRIASSSFTNLGDVTTGVKWQFAATAGAQVSWLGEVRWPTGSREDLTGTGNVVPRTGVAATLGGSDAFRLNAKLMFAKGRGGATLGQLTTFPFSARIVTDVAALDVWAYEVGGEGAIHPRVAISAGVRFRTLLDAVRYEPGNVRSASAVQAESRLIPRPGTLTIASAGVGVRLNVSRSAVAGFTMVIPITRDSGLQPGPTPTVSLHIEL